METNLLIGLIAVAMLGATQRTAKVSLVGAILCLIVALGSGLAVVWRLETLFWRALAWSALSLTGALAYAIWLIRTAPDRRRSRFVRALKKNRKGGAAEVEFDYISDDPRMKLDELLAIFEEAGWPVKSISNRSREGGALVSFRGYQVHGYDKRLVRTVARGLYRAKFRPVSKEIDPPPEPGGRFTKYGVRVRMGYR